MHIKIVCVGKIKEAFYRDAIAEYQKRLSRYAKLQIIEVTDEKTPDRASLAQENQIKLREGERILASIRDTDYVIALSIDARSLDSLSFAAHIDSLGSKGISSLCFVIGGSLGLHTAVLDRADELLSFSAMTFPHQLMRVILLEQFYRACRINHHEPYHK